MGFTALTVSVACDICDENCDWPLRSGVAFSVQGMVFSVQGMEAVHPSGVGQTTRAYEESSYEAIDPASILRDSSSVAWMDVGLISKHNGAACK